MDAEGGQMIHRDMRSRKLAVVVAVQNVLVAACLVVTAYVYWTQGRVSTLQSMVKDVHIQAVAGADITENGTLKMEFVYSNFMMDLLSGTKDKIYTNCTGPYLLYLEVCYTSVSGRESSAELQLQVKGNSAQDSSFKLQASSVTCSELHNITYLKARQEVSLQLFCTEGFKIKNMTVDLNYLLGGRCESQD